VGFRYYQFLIGLLATASLSLCEPNTIHLSRHRQRKLRWRRLHKCLVHADAVLRHKSDHQLQQRLRNSIHAAPFIRTFSGGRRPRCRVAAGARLLAKAAFALPL